mmetsp:Transcript_16459/g.30596  ORF Transcript_16459/g.30596 Transcript_16459/m.30596 type:complete len:80 (-) Transcript_16459:830-1069(-)
MCTFLDYQVEPVIKLKVEGLSYATESLKIGCNLDGKLIATTTESFQRGDPITSECSDKTQLHSVQCKKTRSFYFLGLLR